ncbi:hypothetical protein CXF72_17005 [Psychromonas sp. MB-3u-54]|uniref:protein DpdG n=1 Tax=Psychromonas sp. MB-3u-54 TaxID=2058319 RepID=UPI000C3412CC|nr:protein DpdG [Psychromonas sp. MB-3u-54]PKH01371.1 hypothetical protein CXF72_17005 [Psychromonas sp. MB-3u-54]
MAIINNANRGSHIPTLLLIDELLIKFNTKNIGKFIPNSKLLGSAMPDFLYLKDTLDEEGNFEVNTNAKEKMRESLDFWANYGLWEMTELEGGEKGYQSSGLKASRKNLPKRILDVISNHYFDNGKLKVTLSDFYSSDDLKRDFSTFVFAMCFFLYQEDVTFKNNNFLTKSSAYDLMTGSITQNTKRITFNKSNESSGVINYGHFLGFFEMVGKNTYSVDPTRFVKWYLADIFSGETELGIQDFLNKLNKILPIFDTGPYQKMLPEYLNIKRPSLNFNDGNVQMSSALSLALYRLEQMNLIRLEGRSDSTDRFDLNLPISSIRQVTHIQFHDKVNK